MVQINKIEEVRDRSKFDTIVKFDNRTIVKKGEMNLAEIRTKGRTCYYYVIVRYSRERAVKLVHSYVKRINGECTKSVAKENYLRAA
ncbi:MAG: hypothetical protein K5918_07680 [Bacteroidales bacterium]|nr:hypothetical protein [Bacteroidales bacterium]